MIQQKTVLMFAIFSLALSIFALAYNARTYYKISKIKKNTKTKTTSLQNLVNDLMNGDITKEQYDKQKKLYM